MIRELHIPEAREPVHQGWVLLDHCIKDVLGERTASAEEDKGDGMAPNMTALLQEHSMPQQGWPPWRPHLISQ